jgi:hypothetical protein
MRRTRSQLLRIRHLEHERDSALAGARAQHDTNVCLVAENCALSEKLAAWGAKGAPGSAVLVGHIVGHAIDRAAKGDALYVSTALLRSPNEAQRSVPVYRLATPAPTAGEGDAK